MIVEEHLSTGLFEVFFHYFVMTSISIIIFCSHAFKIILQSTFTLLRFIGRIIECSKSAREDFFPIISSINTFKKTWYFFWRIPSTLTFISSNKCTELNRQMIIQILFVDLELILVIKCEVSQMHSYLKRLLE